MTPKLRGISSIRMLGLLGTALALVSTLQIARAATDSWSGSGVDGNWQTSGNWTFSPGVSTVSASDSLVFQGTTELTNTNNFTAGTAFDGITFLAGSGTFNLMGNGILLSGQVNNWVTSGTNSWTPGVINNSTSAVTINVPLTLDWGNYAFANTNLTGSIAIDGGLTANTGGVAVFGGTGSPITTTAGSGLINTTLTVDPNTGLINNLNGAGLLGSSGTGNLFALLPLATVSGGQVVAYGSSSYDSLNAGTTTIPNGADNNVLLNGNSTSTTYTTAAGSVTDVNTITAATGTNTLTVSGTLVFGAGAADSVGGLYVTGGSNHQVFTFNATGATNAVTAGTTAAGGTIVIAVNSVPAQTSNEVENNEQIQNNAAGGPVTLIKTGPGSMYFNNATQGPDINSYSGGTYVDQGWLQGNATGVFGTGPIYVAGGASLYIETSQSNAIYLSPGLGDNGNVGNIKFGNNSQVQSGIWTLQGAPVTSAPGDRVGLTDAGATIDLTNQITGPGTLDVATQVTSATTIFELDNTTGNANNWTGGTIIESNGGSDRVILEDGANNQIGANNGTSAGNMTFTDASTNTGSLTFDLHGNSDTVGALITNGAADTSGAFVNNSQSGAVTLTIGDNGGTGSFGGVIEQIGGGALTLIKTGTGTQTLTNGASSFTGNVTVQSGTLTESGQGTNSGNTSLGSDASAGRTVTVDTGATLDFGNNNAFGSGQAGAANIPSVTVGATNNTGGTLFAGNYTPLGALNLNGATMTGNFAGNSSYQAYQLLGTVTVAGTAASTISESNANVGVNLTGTTGTTFNVGQTGAVGGDLIITTHLQNASNDFAQAPAGLTKTGLGTLVFEGTNNYTGATNINAGIINYQNGQAFGGSSAITVANNATAQVQNNAVGGSGTLSIIGTGASNATGALESVSGANSYAGPIILAGNATIAADAGSLTLSGSIGDGGSGYAVTTAGAGTITLSGSSTYLGNTNVGNSLLIVTGSLNEAGNVVLSNATVGSVLAGTGNGVSSGVMGNVTVPANNGSIISSIAPGITGTNNAIGELTMSSLTMNGGQLVLALTNATTPGVTYSFVNVTGSLTLPSSWSVTPSPGADAGVYTVLTGGTSNIGAGAGVPTINVPGSDPLVRPAIYTPVFSGNSLQLDVTGGAASIIWSGSNGSGGNAIWDVATTKNWNDSSASTPTGQFFDGDSVTFDDTGSNGNITVQPGTNGETSVLPGGVTVSANTVNYSIGGNPISGATGLLKTGSDTLTLSGADNFTGATTVNAGIINYQNGTAFGTDSAITSASGATVQVQGGITGGSEPLGIGGSGAVGANGALENVSGANSYAGAITMSATSTIAIDAGSLTLSGAIGDGGLGYGVNKVGTGTLTFKGANTFTGPTNVSAGILNYQNGTALGTNSAITVASGAAIQIQGGITSGAQTLTLSGTGASGATGTVENVSGANTLAMPIVLAADPVISSDAGSLTISGGVTGSADLFLATNNGTITVQTNPINNAGGLTNDGTGPGAVSITGGVGSNVTGITESSTGSSLTISGGTGLTVNNSGITLANNNTAGSATLTVSSQIIGSGNLELNNNSAVSNGITLSGTNINNTGSITNGGTGIGSVLISGSIGANVTSLTQNAPDTLTLTASNNVFAGSVAVESGTLAIDPTAQNAEPQGVGSITISSGAYVNFEFPTQSVSNTISGAGTINYSAGTGGANTSNTSNLSGFTGILNIGPVGGKLQLDQSPGQGMASGTINVLNGATLFQNGATTGANINLYGGTTGEAYGQIRYGSSTTSGTITLLANTSLGTDGKQGVIDGPVVDNGGGESLEILGNNTANSGSNYLQFNAADTYSGPTTIFSGIMQLGNLNAAQNTTVTIDMINGLQYTSGIGSVNVGALSGTGSDLLEDTTSGAVAVNAGGNNQSTTYSGILSGIGSLSKSGTGVFTLSGANTYTGATAVTQGALNLTGSLNGSASVTVTNGTFEGNGAITNAVNIGNGTDGAGTAVLIPGSFSTTGTLTLTSGTMTMLSDGNYVFSLNSTSSVASQLIAQAVSLDPASEFTMNDIAATPASITQGTVFTVINTANGISGTFGNLPNNDLFTYGQNDYLATYTSDELTLTVVPEPATWGLMISGLGMLIGLQKMRKRKSVS